jgi:predicted MPP superfamily phosphohydrolase
VTPIANCCSDSTFPKQEVPFDMIGFGLFLLIFIASQLFWISRILDFGEQFIPGKPRRALLALVGGLTYVFVFTYSYPSIQSCCMGHIFRPADYRLHSILIEAAFWWWFVGSLLAFAFLIAFATVDRAARGAAWMYRKARERTQRHVTPDSDRGAPHSLTRRRFLSQTTVLVSATPFVAAGYGLLYGRLDVEVVRRHIRLARLPNAFAGFQIAQLSDVHIGPFTTADYIRACVAITNALKPDLIALTGDYISWDPQAEGEVVRALSGLHAPHGVFACLGNHEEESQTEEAITRLFSAEGIRVLRQERASVQLRGEMLYLMGIDCPRGSTADLYRSDVTRRLQGLVMPGTVNILLSQYPDVFDRAAALGFDLTLAGHTHGGQLSLDLIYRGLNLSHLLYRYDRGWYEKRGAQLYVNRGIGTSGLPIRLGARPEITLIELGRA